MNEIVLLMWGMVGAKCNLTMVSFLAAGDVLTRNDWHGPSSKKTTALQGAHARARVCVCGWRKHMTRLHPTKLLI